MSEIIFFYGGQPILREIVTESLTIGSGPSCDIKLIDSVSTNHARIEATDDGVLVTPLDGPVLFNGERIVGSRRFRDNEVIDLGNYRIQYSESDGRLATNEVRNRTLTASIHESSTEKSPTLPSLYFLSPFKKRYRRYALSLGRDDACDIVISDPYVSCNHAEIEFRKGDYYLKDVNSRNGTFLNDYRVSDSKMPPRGAIRLGRLVMIYEIEVDRPAEDESIPGIAIPGLRPGTSQRMIVFKSELFSQLMHLLKKIAPTEETTLLLGETGVGKDLLAAYLHYNHPARKKHPFIVVNCAEIAPTMADSQFFGHVAGAFTGAVKDHKGFFEQADKGTLFLDEIGELPPDLQAKLLRVMEDGLVRPVGGTKQIGVDVRLVAATNRDLDAGKRTGSFRADLYERFDRMLSVPSLKERKEDIVPIAKYFIGTLSSSPMSLSIEAALALEDLPWAGNVRALRRAIRTAITNATYRGSNVITAVDLEIDSDILQKVVIKTPMIQQRKKDYLIDSLRQYKGSVVKVARALAVSRNTLYEWFKEGNINPKEYRRPTTETKSEAKSA